MTPSMPILPFEYSEHAVLANTVGEEMLSRLSWVTLQPKVIIDVGCGVGHCSALLRQQYPDAVILSLDNDLSMLHFAKSSFPEKTFEIGADGLYLPLPNHSVDLIFANLMLPWCVDMEKAFREWQRVLRSGGLLMFTCLGPDTLGNVYPEDRLPLLMDMHEVGDILTRMRFADPVMDVDYFTLTYPDKKSFVKELTVTGFLQSAANVQISADSPIEATFEIIYGHAFQTDSLLLQTVNAEGVVNIPISSIKRHPPS